MPGERVFVTGAAGFVGAHVVNEALKAGYRVRGSVRKLAQVDRLQKYFGRFYGTKAEFVIVPDITKTGAYDGLLDDVDYVLHVASPIGLQTTNWKKDYIEPAVLGTTTMLAAAEKAPSVKRIVITGSIIDLVPWEGVPAGVVVTESLPYEVTISPDHPFDRPFTAYRASKVLAAQALRTWLAEHNPHFSVITLHPTFIFGRNLLQSPSPSSATGTTTGTNALLWRSLTGPTQHLGLTSSVHVLDVAAAHVRALDPSVGDGEKFLLSSGTADWDDVKQFVRDKYPEVRVGEAEGPPGVVATDAGKAERVLGIEWRDWRVQVGDVVEQELEALRDVGK